MSNNTSILIRANSSSTIGTGHIMRDLVLAKEFEDARIIFATQDLDLLQGAGFNESSNQ